MNALEASKARDLLLLNDYSDARPVLLNDGTYAVVWTDETLPYVDKRRAGFTVRGVVNWIAATDR